MDVQARQRVIITGGSGFLGVSLAHHLAVLNWEVILISRKAPRVGGPWRHETWDGRSPGTWQKCLEGAAAVVNLAGRTVDCIKTPDHCDEILRSRVEATRVLGVALRQLKDPPPVWVQMSTAHIYGDPPEVICDEDSVPGYGLAPWVGRAWEEAFAQSVLPEQRGVVLRTSLVVGRNRGAGGGALDKLAALARWGLGGQVADGTQGMSWIHEHDMNRLFERGLNDSTMRGIYVASAPNPVSQATFVRELRKVAGGLGGYGIGLPATELMVRVGARWLLRTDPELVLYGRYVRSCRLAAEGFEFRFPRLADALRDLCSQVNGPSGSRTVIH